MCNPAFFVEFFEWMTNFLERKTIFKTIPFQQKKAHAKILSEFREIMDRSYAGGLVIFDYRIRFCQTYILYKGNYQNAKGNIQG